MRAIVRAGEGGIWVATSDGIQEYANGVWLGHGDEEGLPSVITHGVAVERGGRVWAATTRGEVAYFPELPRAR